MKAPSSKLLLLLRAGPDQDYPEQMKIQDLDNLGLKTKLPFTRYSSYLSYSLIFKFHSRLSLRVKSRPGRGIPTNKIIDNSHTRTRQTATINHQINQINESQEEHHHRKRQKIRKPPTTLYVDDMYQGSCENSPLNLCSAKDTPQKTKVSSFTRRPRLPAHSSIVC